MYIRESTCVTLPYIPTYVSVNILCLHSRLHSRLHSCCIRVCIRVCIVCINACKRVCIYIYLYSRNSYLYTYFKKLAYIAIMHLYSVYVSFESICLLYFEFIEYMKISKKISTNPRRKFLLLPSKSFLLFLHRLYV